MPRDTRPKVAVVRAGDELDAAVAEALRLCGAGDVIRPGQSVLVKPNIHGGHGITSSAVIAATCRWARERGAARVLVGDGPYYGHPDPVGYFRSLGYEELCADPRGALESVRSLLADHGAELELRGEPPERFETRSVEGDAEEIERLEEQIADFYGAAVEDRASPPRGEQ